MFKKENNKSSSSKFKKWRKLQEKRRLKHEKVQHVGRYHPDPGLKMTNSIQKRRLFRKTIPLLTIFGLTALISLYSIMPISRLASLDVSGGDKQTKIAVIKASGLNYYESLFSIWPDKSKIEKRISDKVGNVKSVKLSISRFNHVNLAITEYRTIGYVERDNLYYKLSSSGMTVNYGVEDFDGSYPVFYGFNNNRRLLKDMSLQVDSIDKKVRGCISEIHFEPSKVDPERVHVYMNDGNEVIAQISTFSRKINYYPQYTAKMKFKGIIDLEVGAYAYPKN
ncbi:cell division protein FtsQ/DivIB [Ligilactobacillus ruminis]|uniref:Cell division protein DivIB n=2 Tax=Ligilactobacillus ruminis TaxID=1623 RepID=A0A837IV88_9LACO|nr:cell division protein FtsQ/DivIB [Ligilactobacillus ruminis]KLA47230.1 cell division protein [Ligilactobacillus ruminis]KRM83552.1 cell division protein [Ligilactobacillus ruminis DSM 20403 = NBRC 102161]SFG26935.1 cell division protein FtsQ [Ligilactobacillus ruminis DSM 20403 = NBRC 102161]